jgi:hypothetical protein
MKFEFPLRQPLGQYAGYRVSSGLKLRKCGNWNLYCVYRKEKKYRPCLFMAPIELRTLFGQNRKRGVKIWLGPFCGISCTIYRYQYLRKFRINGSQLPRIARNRTLRLSGARSPYRTDSTTPHRRPSVCGYGVPKAEPLTRLLR